MSQWTQVDGTLEGVKGSLAKERPPTGTESGASLFRSGVAYWYWHGSLRDMGEDDIPELRDWFAGLCERSQCTSAELDLDCVNRYHFEWDAERRVLVLDVPHLYREAIEAEAGCRT